MAGGHSASDQKEPSAPVEPPPEPVPQAVVAARLETMFSGATGVPVASGESRATSAPSRTLLKDVDMLVDALPSDLFNHRAAHRPCSKLDKRGAIGMAVCDLVGLPLPPWELAEPEGSEGHSQRPRRSDEEREEESRAARHRSGGGGG